MKKEQVGLGKWFTRPHLPKNMGGWPILQPKLGQPATNRLPDQPTTRLWKPKTPSKTTWKTS